MGIFGTYVQQVIGVLVRTAVSFIAGWIFAHGGPKMSDPMMQKIIDWSVPVILTAAMAGWGSFQRWLSRRKLVTAQAMAQVTEHQVEAQIADPRSANPSVNTPKDQVPVIPPPTPKP